MSLKRPNLRSIRVDLAQVNLALRDRSPAFFAAVRLARWPYLLADI
ncbi:MAG: hypothetical protein ABJG15_18100 [Hyphomonadaceae bacterium]